MGRAVEARSHRLTGSTVSGFLRRLWRVLLQLVGVGIGLIGLYALAAVAGALIPARPPSVDGSTGPAVDVLLVAGPIHYDFLLPADPQTRAAFGFAESVGVPISDSGVEWIVVGWGARGFYTTVGDYTDVAAGTVLRSLAGDSAVLRVDVGGRLLPGASVHRRTLSSAAYTALLDSVLSSLASDGLAPVSIVAGAGLTATDAFFEATGRFDLFRTCNQWVSERMAAAGETIGRWTPTPYAVTLSLWWFAPKIP